MILAVFGVRQGESLYPFLFSMYLNDIEDHFILNGFKGIDLDRFKLFLLFYADDSVILSETEEGLKHDLFLYIYVRVCVCHNIIYVCLLMAKSMFSADFANTL